MEERTNVLSSIAKQQLTAIDSDEYKQTWLIVALLMPGTSLISLIHNNIVNYRHRTGFSSKRTATLASLLSLMRCDGKRIRRIAFFPGAPERLSTKL